MGFFKKIHAILFYFLQSQINHFSKMWPALFSFPLQQHIQVTSQKSEQFNGSQFYISVLFSSVTLLDIK